MRAIRGVRGWPLFALYVLIPGCVGPALVIVPEELTNAVEGSRYSQSLRTQDGEDEGLRWEVSSGTLPPGLWLSDDTGLITGRPTRPGVYDFWVSVDRRGLPARSGERFYSITVLEDLTLDFDPTPGRVAESYEYTPTIDGGVPPYSAKVMYLPAGMRYEQATGKVYGTPQLANSGLLLEASVRDSGDPQQTETVRATLVIHPIGVSITTAELDDAVVGVEYKVAIEAENGTSPYTWKVASGVLPGSRSNDDRLRLDRSSGKITGTPSAWAKTQTFTIEVTDSDSPASSDSREFKLVVPVVILTSTLRDAEAGEEGYEQTLGVGAGLKPYTWELTEGNPPNDLELDEKTGVISGTVADDATTATFTVKVTDADSPATTASQELKIVVPVTITTTSLPPATRGVGYPETFLAAANGLPPYTWKRSDGQLPDGLQLDENSGAILGTPTGEAETETFTIQVTDSDDPAGTDEQELTIEVEP